MRQGPEGVPRLDEKNQRVLEEVYEMLARLGRKVREQNGRTPLGIGGLPRSDSNGKIKPISSAGTDSSAGSTSGRIVPKSPRQLSKS